MTVAVALLWWWWPSIDPPAAGEVDVVVITDDVLRGYDRPVGDRLHEAGRAIRWVEVSDVCAELDRADGDTASVDVIVLAAERLPCGSELASWAGSRPGGSDSVLLVTPSSPQTVGADLGGVRVVDVSRLTGATGTETTMPCQWWDQRQGFEPQVCVDGQVTVRDADGELTERGADRVARAVVARLP